MRTMTWVYAAQETLQIQEWLMSDSSYNSLGMVSPKGEFFSTKGGHVASRLVSGAPGTWLGFMDAAT